MAVRLSIRRVFICYDGRKVSDKLQEAGRALPAAGGAFFAGITGGQIDHKFRKDGGELALPSKPGQQPLPATVHLLAPGPAVVPDLSKPRGQHVEQKTFHKKVSVHRRRLFFAAVAVVFVGERDGFFGDSQNAFRADSDAMGIAGKVFDDLHRPGEWALGVNVPIFRSRHVQFVPKVAFGLRIGKEQLSFAVEFLDSLKKLSPEDLGNGSDREEETIAIRPFGSYPVSRLIDSAVGNNPVNVRVKLQELAPGVQHSEKTAFGAEILSVAEEALKGFRAHLKKQVIEKFAVVFENQVQFLGQGEDHVKVTDGEELCFLLFDPFACRVSLANRTVAIATRMPALLFRGASATHVQFSAQGGRSAQQDCVDRLPLLPGELLEAPHFGQKPPDGQPEHEFSLTTQSTVGPLAGENLFSIFFFPEDERPGFSQREALFI